MTRPYDMPTSGVKPSVAGCIWMAFACEFLLLISVAERKVDVCKAHWLREEKIQGTEEGMVG